MHMPTHLPKPGGGHGHLFTFLGVAMPPGLCVYGQRLSLYQQWLAGLHSLQSCKQLLVLPTMDLN